jgi:hypothetical protein
VLSASAVDSESAAIARGLGLLPRAIRTRIGQCALQGGEGG